MKMRESQEGILHLFMPHLHALTTISTLSSKTEKVPCEARKPKAIEVLVNSKVLTYATAAEKYNFTRLKLNRSHLKLRRSRAVFLEHEHQLLMSTEEGAFFKLFNLRWRPKIEVHHHPLFP